MIRLIISLILALLLPLPLFAAQLAYVSCDANSDDSLGYLTITTGTPTIVSGYQGNACRSSHNNDDGDADDFRKIGTALSGNIYVKYFIKYEAEYANTSNNAKLVWVEGATSGHSELIFSGDDTPGQIDFFWQLSGGDAGFDAGTDITKYFNISYTKGEWIKVEVYIQKSTGGGANADGIMRFTVNNSVVFEDLDAVTGIMDGLIHIPGINGTADQVTGHGYWQIDEIELHDSIPDGVPASTVSRGTVPLGDMR